MLIGRQTLKQEVQGSKPTATVLGPRYFSLHSKLHCAQETVTVSDC